MFSIQNNWFLFLLCFIISVAIAVRQKKIASRFIIYDPTPRKLSIFDLQFPGSEKRLSSFILKMPAAVQSKLRRLLIMHYFFSFFTFTWIAVLAYVSAIHTQSKTGYIILMILMFAQPFAFVFQLIDNTALLRKLKDPTKPISHFGLIDFLTSASYVLAIAAISFSFFAFLYLWFTGQLSDNFIKIFSIILLIPTISLVVVVVVRNERENTKTIEAQENFTENLQLKISNQ